MKTWVAAILKEWNIGVDGFKTLVLAAESKDRYEAARAVLSKKGTSYVDRFGAPRPRPEVAIERDSRLAFLRCMSALNLSVEEPEEEEAPKRAYNNDFRKLPEWVIRQREEKASKPGILDDGED
jgi:hypothetical protein